VSDPKPLNLLAVVGTTRSGSTLLDMLIADPFVELSRLSTELGVPVNENRIADESVTLALNHLVGGNPVRFRQEVTIRPDDQWVSVMLRSTKLLMGVATSPLLLKYGYSLSGPPSRARR